MISGTARSEEVIRYRLTRYLPEPPVIFLTVIVATPAPQGTNEVCSASNFIISFTLKVVLVSQPLASRIERVYEATLGAKRIGKFTCISAAAVGIVRFCQLVIPSTLYWCCPTPLVANTILIG